MSVCHRAHSAAAVDQYLWLEAVGREPKASVAMTDEASGGVPRVAPDEVAKSDELPAILPFRARRRDNDGGRDMPRLARRFAACEGSLVEQWRRRIKALARQGVVVLWGGSALEPELCERGRRATATSETERQRDRCDEHADRRSRLMSADTCRTLRLGTFTFLT